MRKGTVFIFTGKYPSDYFLSYIANQLPSDITKKVIKESRYIRINDYDIRVISKPNDRLRGYRPELIYYIGDVDYNICNKRIEGDTRILSDKREPIRYINEAEKIDLREFIDDDYSLLKCRFKKLQCKDKLKYIWLKIRNKFRKENNYVFSINRSQRNSKSYGRS